MPISCTPLSFTAGSCLGFHSNRPSGNECEALDLISRFKPNTAGVRTWLADFNRQFGPAAPPPAETADPARPTVIGLQIWPVQRWERLPPQWATTPPDGRSEEVIVGLVGGTLEPARMDALVERMAAYRRMPDTEIEIVPTPGSNLRELLAVAGWLFEEARQHRLPRDPSVAVASAWRAVAPGKDFTPTELASLCAYDAYCRVRRLDPTAFQGLERTMGRA